MWTLHHKHKNIHPSEHLGTCHGYDGVFVDPVRGLNDHTRSRKRNLPDMPFTCSPTCRGSYPVSFIIWSANVVRKLVQSYASNRRTDESIRAQTLPFLRILVAACVYCRVMSNSILVDGLVRTVIPSLAKSISPRSETNNAKAVDVSGSYREGGKENSRVQSRRGSEERLQAPARLSGRGTDCNFINQRFGRSVALFFTRC